MSSAMNLMLLVALCSCLCVHPTPDVLDVANAQAPSQAYPHKNALEQARHYLQDISPLSTLKPSDYRTYVELTTGCMESQEAKNPNSQKCLDISYHDAYQKRENATFRFWHLLQRNRYLHSRIDCSYDWQITRRSTPRQLQIHQRKCIHANYTRGGAGLEVLAVSMNAEKHWPFRPKKGQGSWAQPRLRSSMCDVGDQYNGSYVIQCPDFLPASANSEAQQATGERGGECTAFIPIFDYENYLQYNELFAISALRWLGGVTAAVPGATKPFLDILMVCPASDGEGEVYSLEKAPEAIKEYKDLLQYIEPQPGIPPLGGVWDSEKTQACLISSQRPILMYGDSHLRYIFDWLATQFMPTQNAKELFAKLPHHHGYVKFPPKGDGSTGYMSYYPMKYLHHTAQKIENICYESEVSGAVGGITVVLGGTGTWDLDTLPLRNTIQEGISKQIFDKLRTVLFECKFKVQLVWLTAPPTASLELKQNKQYRNNYNLAALNRFFIEGIEHIQHDLQVAKAKAQSTMTSTLSKEPVFSNTIEIVDAFAIIFPHAHTNNVGKCKNHFMCRENYQSVKQESRAAGLRDDAEANVWSNSAAGLRVAHQLTTAMCK